MQINVLRALALLLLTVPSCATAASEDRRAYILAHPHGWIELTIDDRSIPLVPVEEESDNSQAQVSIRPPQCNVIAHVNEEPLLWEQAYAAGQEAPFQATTGFRFPAPSGVAKLHLAYSGCRVDDKGKVTSVAADGEFTVQEDLTHEIRFDGTALHIHSPRPDNVVTLEDVYEAVTGRRSPAN